MTTDKIDILGVKIDSLSLDAAVDAAYDLTRQPGLHTVFTPNPEIIMLAREDAELLSVLGSADLLTADGIGVVYAAKMLKTPLPGRVAGYDLVCRLFDRLAQTGEAVFFFGAKPGVAEKAAAEIEKKYPGLRVAGTRDGYFKPEDEAGIIEEINASGAKLLLVCLGAPKQEKWIYVNRDRLLKVNLAMGLGGALDGFAGEVKRAPAIFIRLNLEWLYRLMKQPSRVGRYAAIPKFMMAVMRQGKG